MSQFITGNISIMSILKTLLLILIANEVFMEVLYGSTYFQIWVLK